MEKYEKREFKKKCPKYKNMVDKLLLIADPKYQTTFKKLLIFFFGVNGIGVDDQ